MKQNRPKRQSSTTLILLGILLVVIVVAVVARVSSGQFGGSLLATPAVTKGNSTHDEPTPTPTPGKGGSTSASPTPTDVAIAKPVLQKSSGNAAGSSVPAGSVVEFDCESVAGLGCQVILTSTTNAQVITLDKKSVTDNGRGQSFATWDWTAVKGSWSVAARASNATGKTAESDLQTLEVK